MPLLPLLIVLAALDLHKLGVPHALADSPGWDIELHEKRQRPAGAASAAHHVHDVVLRARRHAS